MKGCSANAKIPERDGDIRLHIFSLLDAALEKHGREEFDGLAASIFRRAFNAGKASLSRGEFYAWFVNRIGFFKKCPGNAMMMEILEEAANIFKNSESVFLPIHKYLGMIYSRMGMHERADKIFEIVLRLNEIAGGSKNELAAELHHERAVNAHRWGRAHEALGHYVKMICLRIEFLMGSKDTGEAEKLFSEASFFVESLAGRDCETYCDLNLFMADIYRSAGNANRAAELLETASGAASITRATGAAAGDIRRRIGKIYESVNKYREALEEYGLALEAYGKPNGGNHEGIAAALIHKGRSAERLTHSGDAAEYFERALFIAESFGGRNHDPAPNAAEGLVNLFMKAGDDCFKEEKSLEAFDFYKNALAISVRHFGETAELSVEAAQKITEWFVMQRDFDSAADFNEKLAGFVEECGNRYLIAVCYQTQGALCRITGRTGRAVEHFSKFIEIYDEYDDYFREQFDEEFVEKARLFVAEHGASIPLP